MTSAMMSAYDPKRTSADCAATRARAHPPTFTCIASLGRQKTLCSATVKGAIERDGVKLNKGS
jgi:hypothetical protein